VYNSRGIEIVNVTISLALSAGMLMASAGTPYRLEPAHFYPWVQYYRGTLHNFTTKSTFTSSYHPSRMTVNSPLFDRSTTVDPDLFCVDELKCPASKMASSFGHSSENSWQQHMYIDVSITTFLCICKKTYLSSLEIQYLDPTTTSTTVYGHYTRQPELAVILLERRLTPHMPSDGNYHIQIRRRC